MKLLNNAIFISCMKKCEEDCGFSRFEKFIVVFKSSEQVKEVPHTVKEHLVNKHFLHGSEVLVVACKCDLKTN